jgi:hypothetical protein
METNPIEMQKYLKGASYPASKDDLVSTAENNSAPGEIVEQLQAISGNEFSGPDQVMAALKKS